MGIHLPLSHVRRLRDHAADASRQHDHRLPRDLARRHPLLLGLPARGQGGRQSGPGQHRVYTTSTAGVVHRTLLGVVRPVARRHVQLGRGRVAQGLRPGPRPPRKLPPTRNSSRPSLTPTFPTPTAPTAGYYPDKWIRTAKWRVRRHAGQAEAKDEESIMSVSTGFTRRDERVREIEHSGIDVTQQSNDPFPGETATRQSPVATRPEWQGPNVRGRCRRRGGLPSATGSATSIASGYPNVQGSGQNDVAIALGCRSAWSAGWPAPVCSTIRWPRSSGANRPRPCRAELDPVLRPGPRPQGDRPPVHWSACCCSSSPVGSWPWASGPSC